MKIHMTDNGPKQCRAASPDTCRAKFNGEKSEHFDNVEEANDKFVAIKEASINDVMKKNAPQCAPNTYESKCPHKTPLNGFISKEEAMVAYEKSRNPSQNAPESPHSAQKRPRGVREERDAANRAEAVRALGETYDKINEAWEKQELQTWEKLTKEAWKLRLEGAEEDLENFPKPPSRGETQEAYDKNKSALKEALANKEEDKAVELFEADRMLQDMKRLDSALAKTPAGDKYYWEQVSKIAQEKSWGKHVQSDTGKFYKQVMAKAERERRNKKK